MNPSEEELEEKREQKREEKREQTRELTIELSTQVKEAMTSDLELATALQEMFAIFHQAHEGVKSGQYASFEDGLEVLTGNRPEEIELDVYD